MLDGREMIRPDAGSQAFVDFLRVDGTYPVGATHPEGVADPGPVRIDTIVVEERNALRAVVRLEGPALAREPARVILRIEAYAGRPWVRLYHSVEFLHRDPRRAFVRRMGLRLPLALAPLRRGTAGVQSGFGSGNSRAALYVPSGRRVSRIVGRRSTARVTSIVLRHQSAGSSQRSHSS